MAQYRDTLSGQRGQASRLGSKKSGLDVTCNGWRKGIRVVARYVNGEDQFTVFVTGGSNGHTPEREIGTY